MTTATRMTLLVSAALLGCGPVAAATDTGVRPDAGGVDAWVAPAAAFDESHTFPSVDLAIGGERLSDCQAWTLHNEEPIYVNGVTMDAGPGWHHSNWMFVPDTEFVGDDGTFNCRDRDFDELQAALRGGGVFFAQSTQSSHEEQRFEPGTAYMIPPHSRIIGTVHVFNPTSEPTSTGITFHVNGIASTDVRTLLRPLALDDRALDLAPHTTTESMIECDLARFGPIAGRLHYVLPHYHGLATNFRLEVFGGPNDGAVVFETNAAIGDPLGSTLEVPYDLNGARGLRLRCTYDNSTDDRVEWGPYRVDEMCMLLAYVDGPRQYAGQAISVTGMETLGDGTIQQTGVCLTISN